MKVLVLGGGSVRGAYQSGVIKAVLESGFEPKIITTISVGSVNGMFLLNQAGKQKNKSPNHPINYKQIGKDIWDFWESEIRTSNDIVKKRSVPNLIWSLLRSDFNGFLDNKPLKNLIKKHIEYRNIQSAPIDIYSGTVSLNSGKIVYANKTYPEYVDFATASSSIPLLMPPSIIRHQPYCDGGLIDSAPLKIAFEKGATEIICISNSPEYVGAMDLNVGKPIAYMDRVIDIVLNNSLNNDIREAELINTLSPIDGSPIKEGVNKGKKRIPLTVIRPDSPIDINIMDFNSEDISYMLNLGYENGKKALNLNK